MSDSPPNKKMPIDRLSSLPDHLLLHVLSFLGVKKAAVTSVLSKRWEFMWAQLPSLVFSEKSNAPAKKREFVSMINRILRIRNGIHLQRFEVSVCYDNSLAPDVDFWVDSVLQNKTNTFSLQLLTRRDDEALYTLPEKMYSNPSFTHMSLTGCVMDTARTIEWKSLASLKLNNIKLAQHVIENILSGCPLLGILFLFKCWGFNCLKVNTRCLHHLQRLEVNICYNYSLTPDVDFWVHSALQTKTNIFSLQLTGRDEYDDLYTLPENVYSNPSFTRMSLRGCIMDTERTIEWKSLTRLDLHYTKLSQHVIDNILSGSPILHVLILYKCWGFNCLKVNNPCLHHLKVNDSDEIGNGPSLEISAPYLKKLDIGFCQQGRILKLRNMTSLVKAHVNFFWPSYYNHEEVINTTREIYEIIQHVNDIHLGYLYFKSIQELVVSGWKMPISRRSILKITTRGLDEQCVVAVIHMLESSPNLEELDIVNYNPKIEIGNQVATHDLNCDLLHLKCVKISAYSIYNCGGERILRVIEALLMKAPVLEDMSIRLNFPRESDPAKAFQRLLACPRSSRKAVIRFHP